MKNISVKVLRAHTLGFNQVAEVGDVLELPEHVAIHRINIGLCEAIPEPVVEAPAVLVEPAAVAASLEGGAPGMAAPVLPGPPVRPGVESLANSPDPAPAVTTIPAPTTSPSPEGSPPAAPAGTVDPNAPNTTTTSAKAADKPAAREKK